jgi:tetratricopeptide (TPR) repeat protein
MRDQTNYGGTNYQINAAEGNTNIVTVTEAPVPIVGIPQNLPRTHVEKFVGRSQALTDLHQRLQQSQHCAITAIAGMGGIGKTELALQYALHHLDQETYPGGLCWIRARETEIGTQLVNFARSHLGLKLPDGLELEAQIGWCWQHWPDGAVLLILDDVTDYSQVQPYLPAATRFKVLLTTRLQLGRSFQQLALPILEEAAALDLLKSLTEADRIDRQSLEAKSLCRSLGYLPLALELVGRYLAQKPDLSLAEMQQRLDAKRLNAQSLTRTYDGMTAQLGVAAAFELSWQELDEAAQALCYLLSLFALAPISWQWVEQCLPDYDPEDLEDLRDQNLVKFSLLQRTGEQTYLLHHLICEFFQAKQTALPEPALIDALKQSLCRVLAAIAREIPQTPTRSDILRLTPSLPHLESAAHHLTDFYDDQDLFWALTGVARFYNGQGLYGQAEPWFVACRDATSQRFHPDHPDVAISLNNLAELYRAQGRYSEAEPLFVRSLSIMEQQLGENHPHVALSLNNLAELYREQERYSEAEPLFIRSLSIMEQQLGENHPHVALSLNNLAGLYHSQGRYSEAEPLFIRSLEIFEQRLGVEHPYTVKVRSNLQKFREAMEKHRE